MNSIKFVFTFCITTILTLLIVIIMIDVGDVDYNSLGRYKHQSPMYTFEDITNVEQRSSTNVSGLKSYTGVSPVGDFTKIGNFTDEARKELIDYANSIANDNYYGYSTIGARGGGTFRGVGPKYYDCSSFVGMVNCKVLGVCYSGGAPNTEEYYKDTEGYWVTIPCEQSKPGDIWVRRKGSGHIVFIIDYKSNLAVHAASRSKGIVSGKYDFKASGRDYNWACKTLSKKAFEEGRKYSLKTMGLKEAAKK